MTDAAIEHYTPMPPNAAPARTECLASATSVALKKLKYRWLLQWRVTAGKLRWPRRSSRDEVDVKPLPC
jgi:hypothetical protein